jgi:PAS domain S-box-containing protein
MTGYSAAEAVGRTVHFLIPDYLIQSGEIARLEESQGPDGLARPHRTVRLARDGREVPVEIVRSAVEPLPADPSAPRWIAIVRDLTERQRLEQRVRQAERLSALGTLMAGLGHEIGTPLAVARGNAEILLSGREETNDGEVLAAIIRATDRVTDLIRRMLAMVRDSPDAVAAIDLNLVVEDLRVFLSAPMRRKGVALTANLAPDLPTVLGHRAAVQQVLMNLVINAWQATPPGGSVELATSVEEIDKHRRVAVRVRDTGCGIAKEHLPRLFDPFFTTKDVGEGTGLGLYIAWQIAEAHNALLFVEHTAPGVGSTFVFALPVPTPDQAPAPAAQTERA